MLMRVARFLIISVVVTGAALAQPQDDCCEHMASRTGRMHGMMGHGMSCRQMASRLDVRVEDSAEGAVIVVRSKDPMMVDQARKMARMMSDCVMSRASASR
jgi:hypothetical protein